MPLKCMHPLRSSCSLFCASLKAKIKDKEVISTSAGGLWAMKRIAPVTNEEEGSKIRKDGNLKNNSRKTNEVLM